MSRPPGPHDDPHEFINDHLRAVGDAGYEALACAAHGNGAGTRQGALLVDQHVKAVQTELAALNPAWEPDFQDRARRSADFWQSFVAAKARRASQ
jgi:hypothetical protein